MWFYRHLLEVDENATEGITNGNMTVNVIDPGFPPDLFTIEQLRNGAIILHIIGMIYMISGWIFLYKEYFIPSLFTIIDRFSCTEDVAALVLAIGTLLPVLIHEVIGIFMAYQDAYPKYNFGQIVGSINFNLLIYLAVAGFAGKSLQLSGSWWILFDHGLSLLLLVLFFLDETLEIWENIILILIYVIYCLVVTLNGKMKSCIIRKCSKASETENVQMEDIANPDGDNMGHTNIKLLTDSILNNDPLSLKLSDKESMLDKIIFVLLFPLIAILWICMNWFDVRKPGKKNYFVINYILSVIFMGALAYLAMWWGTITRLTLALAPEIMGLTVFAIGFSSSIFYLIIKAAKYGCGDLILSMTNSINIFNMTIGIGAPFLMYNIVFQSVTVSAKGMICSVILIIMVLLAVTSILACFKRKLSTIVGIIFIVIYILFVIVALGFTYKWFECPV